MTRVNILVTAAGCPGFAGVNYSLRHYFKSLRIVTCDAKRDVYGRLLADGFYQVPLATKEDDYVLAVQSIVKRESIKVILPLTDFETLALSRHRKEIPAEIPVSDVKFIELCRDKAKLYSTALSWKVAVPQFRVIRTPEDFYKYRDELPPRLCMKPAVSRGSRGFFVISDRNILGDKERRVISEGVATDILREDAEDYLLMEEIAQPEYSIDAFVDGERIFAECVRERVETRQGISYVGRVVDNSSAVGMLVDKLVTRLNVERYGVDGNINVQCIGNPPRLLEVNPRLSGSCVFCTYAGVNFPALAVLRATKQRLPHMYAKVGTTIYRYWGEVFENPNRSDGSTQR